MDQAKFILDKKKLGVKIRSMRTEQKTSQFALAADCDIDVKTIQRVEKGIQNISIEIVFALANGLKIAPDELIKYAIQD